LTNAVHQKRKEQGMAFAATLKEFSTSAAYDPFWPARFWQAVALEDNMRGLEPSLLFCFVRLKQLRFPHRLLFTLSLRQMRRAWVR